MDIGSIGDALDKFGPEALRATATPGGVVAISDRDGHHVVKSFGWADLVTDTKVDPRHTFHGGSLSKLYIAAAAMRLVERGALDLAEPLEGRLGVGNPMGGEVTLGHLLSHTAGLELDSIDGTLGLAPPARAATLAAESFGPEYGGGRARWVAPVGQAFQYSSLGLAMAADVVSDAAGRPWTEVVDQEILSPLGMESTAWPGGSTWEQVAGRRMTGHMVFGDVAVPTPEIGSRAAASTGVVTTVADHNRLMVALLGGSVLSDENIGRMTATAQEYTFFGKPMGMHMGYGLQIRDAGTELHAYGHSGAYHYGWWAVSWAYPKLDLAVTAAGNAWDMRRYMHLESTWPWVMAEEAVRLRAGGTRGDGYRTSYVAGLVSAARVHGLLGIGDVLSDDALTDMAERARLVLRGRARPWKPTDFVAGVRAMQSARTAEEIRVRIGDGDLAADVNLAALMWGERNSGRLMVDPHLAPPPRN